MEVGAVYPLSETQKAFTDRREASDAAVQGLRRDAARVAGADTFKVALYEYFFAEVRTGTPAEAR